MGYRTRLLLLTVTLLRVSEHSRVIDSSVSKGLYVSDYCPFMKGCAKPGIHVMCLRNPNVIEWFGPHCHEAKNITVTDQIALRLLTIVNAIRRKVALGLEKGKDGRYFPRGYGIRKLEWDSELATFAQVWANQCVFRRDFCRATERFPNPSQSLGLVRFSYPDWKPITTSWPGDGFQPQIIVHALIQTVKKWYTMKNAISVDEIDSLPQASVTKPYLNMVSSDVTHMGCGISAFTEYSYNTQNVDLLFNSVMLVCNFSARLTPGTAVYNTTPPTTTDYSTKCGCPPGSKEDGDCLCYPDVENKYCLGSQCKPTVVLLPIFTVEDAPPGQIPNTKIFQNISRVQANSMEVRKLFRNFDDFNNNSISESLMGLSKSDPFEINYQGRLALKTPNDLDALSNYNTRRSSFKTSSATCGKSKPNLNYDIINPTKKIDGINIGIRRKIIDTLKDKRKYNPKFEQNITPNEIGQRFSMLGTKANDHTRTNENLADLLNKLEQAVNRVKLDGRKKQLFDEKIKKIYEKILQRIDSTNRDENKYIEGYSGIRYENEEIHTKFNKGRSYHDSSYLENDEQESNVAKNNKLSKTRKLLRNNKDRHIKRPIIDSHNDQKKNILEEQFIVKDRVVKDDVMNFNRRMYYQKQLENLGRNPSRYTNHKESNRDITRMRPTIN